MWKLLMRVEKKTHGNFIDAKGHKKKHSPLKDYPVFQVFFFEIRTLAAWSTRYASAQWADLRESCTAFARVETSKARVPR